jgi:copper chaperone
MSTMNLDLTAPLPLAQTPSSGCGCCSPRTTTSSAATTEAREKDTRTAVRTTFAVTGMTCGHCVAAVTEELSAIRGVAEVSVDLVPGATSMVSVTSDGPVSRDEVVAALDEAGDYRLASD